MDRISKELKDKIMSAREASQLKKTAGMHTPHDLGSAFSWHERFLETGSMK